MTRVSMASECECFKRSGYDSVQEFPTKEEALERAEEMVEDMNESFCGVHGFAIDDSNDDDIVITMKSND